MGPALDNARIPCDREAALHVGGQILCGRWDHPSRLLPRAAGVQCAPFPRGSAPVSDHSAYRSRARGSSRIPSGSPIQPARLSTGSCQVSGVDRFRCNSRLCGVLAQDWLIAFPRDSSIPFPLCVYDDYAKLHKTCNVLTEKHKLIASHLLSLNTSDILAKLV